MSPAIDATSENSTPSYAPAADQQQSTTRNRSSIPNSNLNNNSNSVSSNTRKKTPSPTQSIKDTPPSASKISVSLSGSTAPDPCLVHISSLSQLQQEVQNFCRFFLDKETEQNWGDRDAAIHKFRGVVLGIDEGFLKGATKICDVIKPIMEPLSQTINSLRSALVFSSCSLLVNLSETFSTNLQPFLDSYIIPSLLKLSASSKKLITKRSNTVFEKVVRETHAWKTDKSTILILDTLLQDKRATVRKCCIDILCIYLMKWGELRISIGPLMDRLEKGIAKCLGDQDGTVRKSGRNAVECVAKNWPDMLSRVLSLLDPTCLKTVSKFLEERKIVGSGIAGEESYGGTGSPLQSRLRKRSVVKVGGKEEMGKVVPLVSFSNATSASFPVVSAENVAAETCPAAKTTTEERKESVEQLPLIETVPGPDEPPTPDMILQMLLSKDQKVKGLFHLISFLKTQSHTLFKPLDQSASLSKNLKLVLTNLNDPFLESFWSQMNLQHCLKLSLLLDGTQFSLFPFLLDVTLNSPIKGGFGNLCRELMESYISRLKSNLDFQPLVISILEELGKNGVSCDVNGETKMTLSHLFLVNWAGRIIMTHISEIKDEYIIDGVLKSFLRLIRNGQDDGVDKEVVYGVLECIKKNHGQMFWKVVDLFGDQVGERVCEICGGREDSVVEDDNIKDGVEEQVVEQVEIDVCQDEMEQNRVVGEQVGMEVYRQKEFESPLAKRPFSSARLSKEAIGQTPPKHARFESLFEEVVALSALLESKQESLVTTSTRIYRLLRKSKSDLCSLPIGSLFRAIGSRIKSDVNNVDEIEILLVLLKEVIEMYQLEADASLQGNQEFLYDLLFLCRSHGTGSVSGTADLALKSFLTTFSPSKTLSSLLSIFSSWDLSNRESPAYQIIQTHPDSVSPFTIKPYPIVSGLYCISLVIKSISKEELSEFFSLDLLPFLETTMRCEYDVVRKASYDCLLPCLSLLKDQFWEYAASRLSEQQVMMLNLLEKKVVG